MDAIIWTEDVEPELKGPYGKAWCFNAPSFLTRHTDAVVDALIGSIIVTAPEYHPIWHSYQVSVVNLKHVDGVPDAVITREGATHEIMVYAINPDCKLSLNDKIELLTPCNFSAQFIATDEEAMKKLIDCVVEILDGKLSPDTDYISMWIERFGDSNVIKR